MSHAIRIAVAAGLALLAPLRPSAAADAAITVQGAWARATPASAQVGAGYATIVNHGPTADRLVGGTFDASAGFELHEMSMDGEVMRMRPVGPLEIPAGGTVVLAPSGRHIMLTGLKHALKKGQSVGGTMVFEAAGTIPVRFSVEGLGAKAPGKAATGHGAHDMPGMDMN